MWIGGVVVVGGLIRLVFCYKHVIAMLLRLEMVMVGLLYLMGVYLMVVFGDYYFFLFFIIFMVSEGVLGLSLMVGFVRWYGEEGYLVMGFF